MSFSILQNEIKTLKIVNNEMNDLLNDYRKQVATLNGLLQQFGEELAAKNEELAAMSEELHKQTVKPTYYSSHIKGKKKRCDVCQVDVCCSSFNNHLKSRMHTKLMSATAHAMPIITVDDSN